MGLREVNRIGQLICNAKWRTEAAYSDCQSIDKKSGDINFGRRNIGVGSYNLTVSPEFDTTNENSIRHHDRASNGDCDRCRSHR